MRKTMLLLLVAFVALSAAVSAASVSRSISPDRVAPGEDVTVTLSAGGVPVGELFTVEEQHPVGWNVLSWDVQGYEGDVTDIELRTVENRRGYSFVASSSAPVVTLVFRVPASAASGNYGFDAVYFDSTGQGRSQGSVTVRTITCGDNVCEGSESVDSCPADCQAAVQPSVETGPVEGEEPKAPVGLIVIAVIVIVGVAAFLFLQKKKPATKGR